MVDTLGGGQTNLRTSLPTHITRLFARNPSDLTNIAENGERYTQQTRLEQDCHTLGVKNTN
jgi:hypothetical protein